MYGGEREESGGDLTLEMDDSLLTEMDMEEIQEAVDNLLGEEDISVSDAILRMINGEDIFSSTNAGENALSLVLEAFAGQREIWMRVLIQHAI